MAAICEWGDNTPHLSCTEEATATWRGDPYCALHKAYFEHTDVCAEEGCENPTNYVEFDAHYRCTDGGTDTRCAAHQRPEVRAEVMANDPYARAWDAVVAAVAEASVARDSACDAQQRLQAAHHRLSMADVVEPAEVERLVRERDRLKRRYERGQREHNAAQARVEAANRAHVEAILAKDGGTHKRAERIAERHYLAEMVRAPSGRRD